MGFLRRVSALVCRRRLTLLDKLNNNIDFTAIVPPAFASAQHFVDRDSGSHSAVRARKIELYRYVNDVALRNVPVDYLEFGVFRGWSMQQWLQINKHPESRFVGFDTFTGLPED